MGAGGYVAETSVIAPSVLLDDVELERIPADFQRPPLVPPPPLAVSDLKVGQGVWPAPRQVPVGLLFRRRIDEARADLRSLACLKPQRGCE
jgi:hypothetical protein